MTGADVVAAARTWAGTPYRHQASIKGVGADCIGFCGGVAVELGIPGARDWASDPDAKGYGRQPQAAALIDGCRRYLDPIQIAQAALGDVLVLRFEREPQHFAIISQLSPMMVIHAYAAARKVTEMGIDGDWRQGISWRSLIVSAWRFRGVE